MGSACIYFDRHRLCSILCPTRRRVWPQADHFDLLLFLHLFLTRRWLCADGRAADNLSNTAGSRWYRTVLTHYGYSTRNSTSQISAHYGISVGNIRCYGRRDGTCDWRCDCGLNYLEMDLLAQVCKMLNQQTFFFTNDVQCPNRYHLDSLALFHLAISCEYHKHSRCPKIQTNGLSGSISKRNRFDLFRVLSSEHRNQGVFMEQPSYRGIDYHFCCVCCIVLFLGILYQPCEDIGLDPSSASFQNCTP